MKYLFVLGCFTLFVSLSSAQPKLETHTDSISFAIGQDVGTNLQRVGIPLDADKIFEGLKAGLSAQEGQLLTNAQMKQLMNAFRKEVKAIQMAENQARAAKFKAEGEQFLAENAQKEGIVTLNSGLQYQVVKAGDGPKPLASDQVEVHYEGRLLNGKVFDSSYERGAPVVMGVSAVIRGWTEALQLMNTGAKWRLFIPSDLAYGDRGAGPDIPPGSALVFDIELLSIK